MTAPIPLHSNLGPPLPARFPMAPAAFDSFQEQLFNTLQPPLALLMQGSLTTHLPTVVSLARRFSSSTSASDAPVPLDRQLAEYILFPLFHHLRTQQIRDLPEATQEHVLQLLFFVWQRLPAIPTLLQEDSSTEQRALPLPHDAAAMQSLMAVVRTAVPQSSEDIAYHSVALLLVILGHPCVPDPLDTLQVNPSVVDDFLTDYSTRADRTLAVPQSKNLATLSQLCSARLGNLLYFQLVTGVVDLFATAKLLRLRLLALVAIHDLLLVVAQDPDVVGFVLPSVMSKLTTMFCEPKPNSALVVSGLRLLERLIPFALQQSEAAEQQSPRSENGGVTADADTTDEAAKAALAEWERIVAATTPTAKSSSATVAQFPTRSFPLPAGDFVRNRAWFATTSANLVTTLAKIFNTFVVSTASPDVLIAACDLARTLTTRCCWDLAALLPDLFKFAAACSLSDFDLVRASAASVIDCMFCLPGHLDSVCVRALSDALRGLTSLASVSDEDKVTRLHHLRGCLVAYTLAGQEHARRAAEFQTAIAATVDTTLLAWRTLLVVDAQTPLRSETDARFRRWNFLAFHQLSVADAAWDTIGSWARAGGEAVAQALLGKLMESMHEADQEEETVDPSAPIAVAATYGTDPMTEFRKRLLAARFAAHTHRPDQVHSRTMQHADRHRALYAVFAAALPANPSLVDHATLVLETTPPADPLIPALVLTGLQETRLSAYTDFVRTHLPLLLVHSTSSALPLQRAAQAYLEKTLIPHLQCTSMAHLLDKYAPYLMHHVHLGLAYPLLDSGLPKMLLAVARAKAPQGPAGTGWVQDLVAPVMEALARHLQHDDMWRAFTLALLEMVRPVQVEPLPVEKQEREFRPKQRQHLGNASAWIQMAFGPAAVAAAKAARDKAQDPAPWERRRQPGEPLPHEHPQDNDDVPHPFDAGAHADDDDDITSLPGPVQSLLSILHHARNLIQTAPPRTRVELVRLATEVIPKLDTYTKHTRHLVYRILNVMTLDAKAWIGTGAELAYVSEAACAFLAAAAHHSPEYAAQKALEYFGSPVVELVRRGVPAAVDLLVAVVEADNLEGLGGGVVTPAWARLVVEAALPRFVAPWTPALRRHGREDLRPKLEAALSGLVRGSTVGDGVWAALVAARAALLASESHDIGPDAHKPRVGAQEWCVGVPKSVVRRWKGLLPATVDPEQVAKLDVILSARE